MDRKWARVDPVFSKWHSNETLEEFTPEKSNIEALAALNPVQVFEKFLDDSTIKYIVEQTIIYSAQDNRHDFSVTEEEIRIFIAILFLSGYHPIPQKRMYRCKDEDLGRDIVPTAMPRNQVQSNKAKCSF
nr:unnamed protein product [Callosobruchus chinensis]